MSSRFPNSRQTDRDLRSTRIVEEEINYIDHNRKMSPLTRIMGNDKRTGPKSFRSQQKALQAKRDPSPPQVQAEGEQVFLTQDERVG